MTFVSRPTDRIVGVRSNAEGSLRVYRRTPEGVTTDDVPFRPWCIVGSLEDIPNLPAGAETIALDGPHRLRVLIRLNKWPDLWEIVRLLLRVESDRRRQRLRSYADVHGLFLFPEAIEQWLCQSQGGYYRGLAVGELVRMQVGLYAEDRPGSTAPGLHPEARLSAVTATDTAGGQVQFRIQGKDERTLIEQFLAWVQDRDPDTLEADQLVRDIIPYLKARCDAVDLPFALGREGSVVRITGVQGLRSGWEVPGRVCLDLGDANAGLDVVIRSALGPVPAPPNPPTAQSRRSKRSLLAECRAARNRSTTLFPLLLSMAELTPIRPDYLLRTSSSSRLDAALLRALLAQGSSIPAQSLSTLTFEPAETEYRTGVFKASAELALPGLSPKSLLDASREPGHAELPLAGLVAGLGLADDRVFTATSHDDLAKLDLLYGAVEAVQNRNTRWWDSSWARRTDEIRQSLLRRAWAGLEAHSLRPLQTLDDAVLCELPDNLNAGSIPVTFWKRVVVDMPDGLVVRHVRTFERACSFGPRTIALLAGERATLLQRANPPRSFEPFLREFYVGCIELLLRQDWVSLHRWFVEAVQRVRSHAWNVGDFQRREVIAESMEEYAAAVQQQRRHASAVYEALRRAERTAAPGTAVSFYITGTRRDVVLAEHSRLSEAWDPAAPDENSEYYVDRVKQCAERFRILFHPPDFERIFGLEDLFGFEPGDVRTVEALSGPPPTSDLPATGPSIWLDAGPTG